MIARISAWLLTHVILVIAKKEADKAGVALFSETNALRVRRYIIAIVMVWLTKVTETKWAKRIETDNQAVRFWELLWKSDTLGESIGEKSLREARKLLTDVISEFGQITYMEPSTISHLTTIREKIIAAGMILDAKDIQR